MQSMESAGLSGWAKVDDQTHHVLWDRFDAMFGFERSEDLWAPVIRDPAISVTFDLSVPGSRELPVATFLAIEVEALRCFSSALPGVDELFVLDWQHTSYRFRPAAALNDLGPKMFRSEFPSVYPDGDYYAYLSPDFSEGTFGHPWEQSLCVFGERMVASLARTLATWLPVKRVGSGIDGSFV